MEDMGSVVYLVHVNCLAVLTEAPVFPVTCYAKELNYKIHSCSILMNCIGDRAYCMCVVVSVQNHGKFCDCRGKFILLSSKILVN